MDQLGPHEEDRAPQVGDVVHILGFLADPFVVAEVNAGPLALGYRIQPAFRQFDAFRLEVPRTAASTPEFEARVAVLASLAGHPNLTEVIWYGPWRGQPAVISKWHRAVISHARLAGLEDDVVAGILGALVAGLGAAAERGLVHGDLRPHHLRVDPEGSPRVGGFLTGGPPDLADPLYAAPEIRAGAAPTLAADLYALGATFLELLTGAAPSGEGAGAGVRRRFEPLVTALLAAEPSDRPASYGEVTALLGLPEAAPDRDADGVVAEALYLRRQGRSGEALAVVRAGIERFPEDPVVWNALAMNLRDTPDAEGAFRSAVSLLRASGGVRHGRPYLDPAINLFWYPLMDRRYAEAADLLRDARAWGEVDEVAHGYYLEFAWLDLWEQRPAEAADFLARELPERDGYPVVMAHWYLLAAIASGRLREHAPRLAAVFTRFPDGDHHAVIASAIGRWLDRDAANDLLATVPREAWEPTREFVRRLGLPAEVLGPPAGEPLVQWLAMALDERWTGGRLTRGTGSWR